MRFRFLLHDPARQHEEPHTGGWRRAGVYDATDPNYVKAVNKRRETQPDCKAVLVYADGPLQFPVAEEDIAVRLAPGEWLFDPEEPKTWDAETRKQRRQEGFIRDLCDLNVKAKLTAPQRRAVVQLVKRWGLTPADFWNIDSKPGTWGYEIECGGAMKTWHWKLRQVRNDKSSGLFDVLQANLSTEPNAHTGPGGL